MGISSPGIGSGLDVNSIVSKLMSVESAPLTTFDNSTASYQATLSAYGTLSGALGTFQGSLAGLSSLTNFQSLTSTSSNTNVMVGAAVNGAAPGNYRINVTQVAQSQSLATAGILSNTAAIGLGTSTTVSFQLGAIAGGTFGLTGAPLSAGTVTGGITAGALSINNTVITTNSTIKSAKLLADAINAQSATTGVSAKAAATSTSATLFGGAGAANYGNVDTSGGGTYTLSVGGVHLAVQAAGVAAGAAGGVTAAGIDSILGGTNSVTTALAQANITVSGTAAGGDLTFTNPDGSNIDVTEDVTGAVTGGLRTAAGAANNGSTTTASSSISLVSANASQITVGGTNAAAAGFTAGVGGAYLGATFTQDGSQTSGSVVIDSTNNSLQGIRDAINKAGFGVTAAIVSDGSALPNHLVLTSTQTGATSSMKITLAGTAGGAADTALTNLLSYDAAGTQSLSQTSSAQSSLLNVNGIAVTSTSTTVTGAIQDVTLTLGQVGSANLVVAKDNTTLTGSVNGFIKAYNDLNTQIGALSGYNATTKVGGPLLGDSTTINLQAQVRKQLSQSIAGLKGNLTSLSQIGISFQKDGSLMLDSAKLSTAITKNFGDIAGLFAAVGKSSDTLVNFTSSTAATKAGDYALNITAVATQGSITGAAALGASTVIDPGTNFTITLNDTTPSTASNTATVAIPAGSYTPTQLSTLLQSTINGVSGFSNAGSAVTASIDPTGKLQVSSTSYGVKSNILIADGTGTAVSTLFGGAAAVAGVDVAGTIGGYSATGSGQTLTGSPGAPTEGLKLEVTGGVAGERGTIGFSQGYAYQLNNLAATYLGSSGFISGRTNGINSSIKSIATQRAAFAATLTGIEARYRSQYSALDTSIASMNTTTTFLTQQFAAMAKNN
ncbi:MAG TPA: flagellar hook protein 2 [Janthinobacterium sp.]|nr:flagellar hook protein 2 [Janthinobacterium sp.]